MRAMILLMLLTLFAFGTMAQAQDFEVPCADLAEADCEILRQSQQAMLGVTSYNFQLAVDLNLQNIPDVPMPLAFNLAGTGTIAGDFSAMQSMSMDMASAMGDPEAYSQMVQDVLRQLNLGVEMTLSLPEELVAQAGGQIPAAIPLEVRLVDGVGYINLDPLREALGEEMSGSLPPGWMGLDLAGFVAMAMEQSAAMSDMEGMADAAAMQSQMMEMMTDPEFTNSFIDIVRQEDITTDDGAQAAVFHMTLDYGALMSDPTMQEMMQQSMEASGETLSEEEMQEAMGMVSQMFEGFTIEARQTIDLETFYQRATEFNMTFDFSALQDMMASELTGETTSVDAPFVLTLHALVTNSDFNSAAAIEAPDNATLIPLESMAGMSS